MVAPRTVNVRPRPQASYLTRRLAALFLGKVQRKDREVGRPESRLLREQEAQRSLQFRLDIAAQQPLSRYANTTRAIAIPAPRFISVWKPRRIVTSGCENGNWVRPAQAEGYDV